MVFNIKFNCILIKKNTNRVKTGYPEFSTFHYIPRYCDISDGDQRFV